MIIPPQTKFRGVYRNHPVIPPANEVWGVYRNHPVCLSVCSSVQSKLNLGYNFWTVRDKAFILHMWIPYDKAFSVGTKNFDLVTLTLTFDLLFKKLNLSYNFWTKRGKAFILHMWVPYDMTFLFVPKILTLWPWPWLLTYFSRNLTLAITFEPKEIRLS